MKRISKPIDLNFQEPNIKEHHRTVTFPTDEWEWNKYEHILRNEKWPKRWTRVVESGRM